jgi:dinuclear metal center YbgI/SA1388 family protein
MQVKDVLSILNEMAPRNYAEDFDNTGLLVGQLNAKITGIMITLDTLETVVDEALENDCNLIVSFHPIIFSGLKKLTGNSYIERVVMKAIKQDVHIIAVHTALDNAWNGVNAKICEKLHLKNRAVLIPQKGTIKKLTTFVPVQQANEVRTALFEAGAGSIGNYSNCSFNILGKGSFQGNDESNPTVGNKGQTHFEEEMQLGVTFPKHLEQKVTKALFASHPYEEVAYEITTLENNNQHIGMGMVGELASKMDGEAFISYIKRHMDITCVRHSRNLEKPIAKVAVLGGSGSFAIEAAKAAGADAYVTADLKYHDFFKAEDRILLCDVGHYESEQYTKELLHDALTKKITNFAPALPASRVLLSKINTNPISYS